MPPPMVSAAAASQMRCVGPLGQRHASAEIQGRVRREASDQDGQGNEIRIVCSVHHCKHEDTSNLNKNRLRNVSRMYVEGIYWILV